MNTPVFHLALAASLALQAIADSNTTNILDGVATNAAGPFVLGDTGPFNFLLITNGGALTNTVGMVGNALDAHANLAIITGTNSVWHNSSNFIVGATGGLNHVSILDGARVSVGWQAFLGLDPASANNVLLVSDPGTFLDMPWFHLGQGGSGNQVIVTNSARVGHGISNDLLNNIGEEEGSAGNLLLVAGPGTSWHTDGFRVGNRGPRNRAIVRDGARLTNGFLTVGREITAMANSVEVLGAGSVWKVQNPSVLIGFNGSSNRLLVANGARFETPQATIGLSNAARLNLASLEGAGTVWANAGSLTVGGSGSHNALSIANGAFLRSGSISIGNNSTDNMITVSSAQGANTADLWIGSSSNASRNEFLLDGPGTVWTNASRVNLGSDGSNNRLVIAGGAVFRVDTPGSVGFTIGGSMVSGGNELLVTGLDSMLLGNWALRIGSSGSANRLVAADGARVQSSNADIGQNCIARDNIAFITGTGTVWSNGQLQVGFCSTNNHLVISNGAQVFAGLVRSSVQGGASNTITVSGPGSLLRAAGDLTIGNSGTANSLLVTDGGRVEGRNDRIGWTGGNHAAVLHDVGTSWSNSSLTIGDATPENQLTVAEGARLDSGGAMLGAGAKSSGNTATISGEGTAWSVATSLMVGGLGHSNRLSLSEGAIVSARNVYLGAGSLLNPTALYNSDWNHVALQGTNAALNAASNLIVGASGRWNRTEVREGAQLASHDGVIGLSSGSRSNSVLVTGNGSAWHNAGNLLVGSNGSRNDLIISQGGRVTAHTGYIGFNGELEGQGSSCVYRFGGNRVLVTDPGSVWSNSEQLYVGYGSVGNMLIVSNGGTVRAAGLIVGHTNGVQPGSSCNPSGSLVVDGGCLSVSNATANAILDLQHGGLTLRSGLVTADRLVATNGARGGLLFYGGTLKIRDGDIAYPGASDVGFRVGGVGGDWSSATLVLEGGTLNAQHSFLVEPHAVLAGNGVVNSLIKSVDGTIAPGGRGPGRLALLGGLFTLGLGGLGSLSLDIAGTEPGVEYDQFVTDAALFHGCLDVRLRGGFIPQSNDMFEVIKCNLRDGGFWNVSTNGRVLTVDRLGSFRVNYSDTNIVLTDYRSTDLDADGIEDAWATNYFGHSPLTVTEKSADADGDGASNGEEFRAGTDPLDAASVFRVSILGISSPRALEFPWVPGREYRIWYSNDLVTWREVPNPSFSFSGLNVCDWTDDGKDTGGLDAASRFYRVTME